MQKDQRIRVCIVGEAETFGGSIVSVCNLIKGVDHDRVDILFVSAANRALIESQLENTVSHIKLRILRKRCGYRNVLGVKATIDRAIPFAWRNLAYYLLYALRLSMNIPFMVKLSWLVLRHRTDIIQLNNGWDDEVAFVSILTRRSPIVFCRGYVPINAVLRKFFLPKVHACVAVSEYVKERAVLDGVPAEIITVDTPSVCPKRPTTASVERLRDSYGIPVEVPVIGAVGRIMRWKGQKQLLEAAAITLKAFPEARVLIVGNESDGDPSYVDELRDLVNRAGITDRVIFTGYVDNMHEHYALMDVAVHSAIEPEPSGRVIMEAQSYGLPIIASHLGGPREFVAEGVDGYICNPHEVEDVAEKLVQLLNSEDLRLRMGALGRRKVLVRFGTEEYARRIQLRYHELMEPTGQSRLRVTRSQ